MLANPKIEIKLSAKMIIKAMELTERTYLCNVVQSLVRYAGATPGIDVIDDALVSQLVEQYPHGFPDISYNSARQHGYIELENFNTVVWGAFDSFFVPETQCIVLLDLRYVKYVRDGHQSFLTMVDGTTIPVPYEYDVDARKKTRINALSAIGMITDVPIFDCVVQAIEEANGYSFFPI